MTREQATRLGHAALTYARFGWAVLPLHSINKDGRCTCGRSECPSPGKHPLTAHGVADASKDPTVIARWWRQWPWANIGIATGAASGFFALDVDGEEGQESLRDLEASHGGLPDTVEALTGGGGRHIFFRYPGSGIGNKVGLAPGLDVRGDGGYICAAPSLHVSGRRYEWEVSSCPEEVPLAEAPEWLLNLIKSNGSGRLAPEDWEAQIPEGQRNIELTRRAGSLLSRGIPPGEVVTMLLAWNEKHCKPPLPEEEVKRIVQSIAGREAAKEHANAETAAEAKVRPELTFRKPWFHPNGKEIRVFVKATLPRAIMSGGHVLAKENVILTDPKSIEAFIAKVSSCYQAVVPEDKRMQEGPIDEEWMQQEITRWLGMLTGADQSPEEEKEPGPLAGTPYAIREDRLCLRKRTDHGTIFIPLSNFVAQVVRDVARDDGAEVAHIFEIEGRLASGEPLPRIAVPEDRFPGMNWVLRWGIGAVITAGQGNRDHLRAAIQLLSRGAVQERVFTHLGWRRLDGRWVFLHAGGAVGADNVLVEPEAESLRSYVLPTDGSPEEAMRASLRLLDIGPPEVTHPLWAAVWRAPTACLLYPTVVFWLYGKTGNFKSTLAALFLSHFGGPFTKDSLPANWLATDNALERLAFLARDVILVVDDYAPEKHPHQGAELDKRVNRLVRQVGNRAARTRLAGDLKARPETPPNALVIATGEQLPLGIASVAARILPVLCKNEKIDVAKLSQAQAEAYLLPQAMRGYLGWLAPRMDELAEALPKRFEELRAKATIEGHARLPEAVAHLCLGTELGTNYAVQLGVLTEAEAGEMRKCCWNALLTLAREHARTLEEERPVAKFIQVLDAIFTQKKGHLVDRADGGRPVLADLFGWQLAEEDDDAHPGGEFLGWADKDGLYLVPEAAFRAVSEYLRAAGGLPVRERTLRDLLIQEGIAEPGEGGRSTRQMRCQGSLKRVLHLRLNSYLSFLQKAGTTGTQPASPTAPTDSPFPPSGNNAGTTAAEVGTPPDGCSHFGGQCSRMFPEGGNAEKLAPQGIEPSVPDVPACGKREGVKLVGI